MIATTRPETILGDVAVAVHQDDVRYAKFVGRNLWHPFRQEPIPVISDPFVEAGFGTGLYYCPLCADCLCSCLSFIGMLELVVF